MSRSCPHACGDGPNTYFEWQTDSLLSPRVWGWTDRRRAARTLRLVVPTRVGMDRREHETRRDVGGCPHACGDGPNRMSDPYGRSSVVPTRVGMDRAVFSAVASSFCCPHACGDGPGPAHLDREVQGVVPTRVGMDRWPLTTSPRLSSLSPRVWGWTGRQSASGR